MHCYHLFERNVTSLLCVRHFVGDVTYTHTPKRETQGTVVWMGREDRNLNPCTSNQYTARTTNGTGATGTELSTEEEAASTMTLEYHQVWCWGSIYLEDLTSTGFREQVPRYIRGSATVPGEGSLLHETTLQRDLLLGLCREFIESYLVVSRKLVNLCKRTVCYYWCCSTQERWKAL